MAADSNGARSPNKQEGDRLKSEETEDSFLTSDEALGASMEEEEGIDFGEGDEDPGVAEDDSSEGEGEEGEEESSEEEEDVSSGLTDEDRQKIAIVDSFNANPQRGLEILAENQGYELVRKGEKREEPAASEVSLDDVDLGELEWLKEPLLKIVQAATGGMVKKSDLDDIRSRLETNEEQSVSAQLTELWPAWKSKESEIRELIRVHPTLTLDLPKLIQLVRPTSISGKTKAVLKKGATTTRSAGTRGVKAKTSPKKVDVMKGTFEDAFMAAANNAAAELESRGEL